MTPSASRTEVSEPGDHCTADFVDQAAGSRVSDLAIHEPLQWCSNGGGVGGVHPAIDPLKKTRSGQRDPGACTRLEQWPRCWKL